MNNFKMKVGVFAETKGTKGKYGQSANAWEHLFNIGANVRTVGTKEGSQGVREINQSTYLFEVRRTQLSVSLTHKNRLEMGGVVYDITEVDLYSKESDNIVIYRAIRRN